MRTKRKLLPKSDVNSLGQGNAPSGNINYVAQHGRVPELCPDNYDSEYIPIEGVRNDYESLESGQLGHLGVSSNRNISASMSPLFVDDVCNVKRRRLCRINDVAYVVDENAEPSQPTRSETETENNIHGYIHSPSHNVSFVSVDQCSPDAICRDQNQPVFSGIPSTYKSIGKCEYSCQYCGALFWYDERLKSIPQNVRPKYNGCCKGGRVVLRTYQIYPEYIKLLLQDRHFMENIRAYNQMFSMTSLGANIDESINIGRGPYVFKISGQLYHWIGSLCPEEGQPPRFLQLYVYDTDNEVDNRMNHFGGQNSNLRRDIVEGLIELLDTHNALVQLFRTAREKLADTDIPNFQVRLYNVVGAHEYELPTGDTLGAIVYEPGPETQMDYDIIIEERSGHPQRVNKLHPSYMSLQFPLLFLYGEDGYSKDFKLVGDNGRSKTDRRLTMKAYYAYLIHDRKNSYNYLSRTGRLFQQYVVTAFCAIEQNRIDFIREHQNNIRNEYLSGIYDAINRGDIDGSDCGGRLILPQSFTGGPRYMYSHYLDALAICRVHGNPSFFITFTCNVKWPEITEYMADFPLLTTTDRADIVDRVFEMKVQQFVRYLRDSYHVGQDSKQRVVFRDKDKLDDVIVNTHLKKSTLTEWLQYNEQNIDGRHLTYLNFPNEFVWNSNGKYSSRRRQRHKSSIGRLIYVHPATGDLFYQRMLLCHQKGCRSFPEIHKVNGIVYPTCRAACQALGLLEDDQEWENTMKEAACTATPAELRTLFAHILTFCQVTDPVTYGTA
ncbi:DNA helicase [Tanacetum coccineum]